MIRLNVEEYCHKCPDFKATVHKPLELYFTNDRGLQDKMMAGEDTTIACASADRCANIFRIMKKVTEEKITNDQD